MMCSSNMSIIRWILLQKDFCNTEHKFSAPWARRSKDVWGTASLCVKLTSDFGNVPEGIANSDYCLLRLLARHLPFVILGLLQHYQMHSGHGAVPMLVCGLA